MVLGLIAYKVQLNSLYSSMCNLCTTKIVETFCKTDSLPFEEFHVIHPFSSCWCLCYYSRSSKIFRDRNSALKKSVLRHSFITIHWAETLKRDYFVVGGITSSIFDHIELQETKVKVNQSSTPRCSKETESDFNTYISFHHAHFSQPPAAWLLFIGFGVYLNRESFLFETRIEIVNIAVLMLNTFTHLHLFFFTDLLFGIGRRRQPHFLEGDLSFRLPAKNKNTLLICQLLFYKQFC